MIFKTRCPNSSLTQYLSCPRHGCMWKWQNRRFWQIAMSLLKSPCPNSTEGIEELSQLAAQKNRKVMVGFCFRYHTALLEAKTRLESGEIGRLISISRHDGRAIL